MRFRALLYQHLLICIVCVFVSYSAYAGTDYQVKAMQTIKFMGYVEWPGAKKKSEQNHLNICVYGDTEFSKLKSFIAGISKTAFQKKTWHYTFSLKKIPNLGSAADTCHALFLGESSASTQRNLALLKGRPILVLSDTSNFAEQGGMIGFVLQKTPAGVKVKFEINLRSLKAANMEISADVLDIANKVVQ
ncbi:MAG: YfiR family protein [Rickettsiales bacterium]